MRQQRVVEQRPELGVDGGGLVPLNRAQHRLVGVRLMIEEVAEERDHRGGFNARPVHGTGRVAGPGTATH